VPVSTPENEFELASSPLFCELAAKRHTFCSDLCRITYSEGSAKQSVISHGVNIVGESMHLRPWLAKAHSAAALRCSQSPLLVRAVPWRVYNT